MNLLIGQTTLVELAAWILPVAVGRNSVWRTSFFGHKSAKYGVAAIMMLELSRSPNSRCFELLMTRIISFAVSLAVALGFQSLAVAQSRLLAMPGYEHYKKMRDEIPKAWKSGALDVDWQDGGKAFEYDFDGKHWRYDIEKKAAEEKGPEKQKPVQAS